MHSFIANYMHIAVVKLFVYQRDSYMAFNYFCLFPRRPTIRHKTTV